MAKAWVDPFVPDSWVVVAVVAAAAAAAAVVDVVASFVAASGPGEAGGQSAEGLVLGDHQGAVAEKPWGDAGTGGAPLGGVPLVFQAYSKSVCVGVLVG